MPDLRFCSACGVPLATTAKFCHRCGTSTATGSAQSPRDGGESGGNILPWSVAGIALLCLLAFIVGQAWRRPAASPPAATSGAPAVDISRMSPEERADRLFQRVMQYVSQGQTDSVRFFAPMAIQSALALVTLDAHGRYDLGLLAMVSDDAPMARAQADTILKAEPAHLLGLILGMRLAGLRGDSLARRDYANRFLAALGSERARALPEYTDHAPDIDAAAREAAGGPSRPR